MSDVRSVPGADIRPAGGRSRRSRKARPGFEALIGDVSASLSTAPAAEISLAVESALERIRTFFRADRCTLLSVGDDGQSAHALASCAEGVSRGPTSVNLGQAFPWSRHLLLVGREPVRVSTIADLPPAADVDRASWRRMSTRSVLSVPIEFGGAVGHVIALDVVRREREWPDRFATRLRVLGETLVGAIERRETAARIDQAEAAATLVAEWTAAGTWTLDGATGILGISARARAIFGYSPDEIVTRARFEASAHPDDRGLVRDLLERSLRERSSPELEYRILPGDGSERTIAIRCRPRSTIAGQPEGLTGICRDVTVQRANDRALRLSLARLATGADLAGLGFYEVDFGARSTYIDDRFRAVCGVPREREDGLQPLEFWMECLHPDDRQWVLDVRRELHDGILEQVSIEYRYLHPTRGEIWLHHLGRVFARDDSQGVFVTSGVLREVTERKRIEYDLRDLSQRLIRAHEEQRAQLARELHDDLTQRLAALAIDVDRLERTSPPGERAETLRGVHEELTRLSEDIHALAYQLHPSILRELGLVEALRAESDLIRRNARIDLALHLDERVDAIGADAALCLFRVAQEALGNAVRHAAAHAVSVTLRPLNGGLTLLVRDDGVGFDPEGPGKRRSLGLSSMRERCRLLDGTFEIRSALGEGTTIVAWLPGVSESP